MFAMNPMHIRYVRDLREAGLEFRPERRRHRGGIIIFPRPPRCSPGEWYIPMKPQFVTVVPNPRELARLLLRLRE